MVVPGLTGHAQVNGGYSLKPEEKIIYDMEYIENDRFGWIWRVLENDPRRFVRRGRPIKKDAFGGQS